MRALLSCAGLPRAWLVGSVKAGTLPWAPQPGRKLLVSSSNIIIFEMLSEHSYSCSHGYAEKVQKEGKGELLPMGGQRCAQDAP
eukprot:1145412-Pelagomonas_calceolata.AAC.3